MAGRTIAIGDIHGCSAAFETLLAAIQPDRHDSIVTLGDYIDRGPDSRGVVDRLIRLAGRCHFIPIQGNHEEMFAAALRDKAAIRSWLECGGVDTLRSYGWAAGTGRALADWFPKSHLEFLAGCRPYFETETHVFVHAGLVADVPLDRQPGVALRWRVTQADTAVPHCSGKVTVVGHTPQHGGEVLDLGFLICIDTNCARGGWLTAIDVGSGRGWQADDRGRLRTRDG
jgi:serine/threonine protein phosphatase 1